MAFSFSLEKVLNFRLRQEQEKKGQLREALLNEMEKQKQLEETMQEITAGNSVTKSGRVKPELLQWQYAYRQKLIALAQSQQRQLTEKVAVVEEKRGELLAARTETRIMEKIRDKEWDSFLKEEKRLEQLELDQVGLNVFLRAEK